MSGNESENDVKKINVSIIPQEIKKPPKSTRNKESFGKPNALKKSKTKNTIPKVPKPAVA